MIRRENKRDCFETLSKSLTFKENVLPTSFCLNASSAERALFFYATLCFLLISNPLVATALSDDFFTHHVLDTLARKGNQITNRKFNLALKLFAEVKVAKGCGEDEFD